MAHHGNTPAAWTGVTFILVGFIVGGIGLMVDNWLTFWIGVALCPIGAIIGKIMQVMGLGAEPREQPEGRAQTQDSAH